MNKKIPKLLIMLLPLISLEIGLVKGGVLEETIQDAKLLLYGVAAGVAILLLVIYGLKMKMASSPAKRKEAKRAVIYVILGLVLIIIGSVLVELIYKIPLKPPSPVIINARSWSLSNPVILGDVQTGLEFDFENTLSEDLTGIEVGVSSLKHDWCDEDLVKYIFPEVGIINSGNMESYSYDNFCENSIQFSIQVRCNENWWNFCLECPPSPGGDCTIDLGNC